MRSVDASAEIDRLSAALTRETDGSKVLIDRGRCGIDLIWKLWKDVPVRFARRSPQRLGPNGRWRAGRTDLWLTLVSEPSLLTKSPHRATHRGMLFSTTSTRSCIKMTIALLAVDRLGHWYVHGDFDGRWSLALDRSARRSVRMSITGFSGFWKFSTFAKPRLYRAFGRRGSPDTSAQFASRVHDRAMAKGMPPIAA